MRLASVLACLVVTAAGCSLVVGTDGLSGGSTDGGADVATTETSTGDGAVDGGPLTDATNDVLDANARGCGLYADATFCQDFDDPTTALSLTTWTEAPVIDPAGTITLVEAGAVSAPNAARIDLRDAASGCDYLRLSKTFPGARSGLTARLAVRADGVGNFLAIVAAPSNLPGNTYRVLISLGKPPGTNGYLGGFIQKHDSSGFSDVTSDALTIVGDPVGKDYVVSVEVTAAPDPKVVVHKGTETLTLAAPADLSLMNARIDVGPYCQGQPQTFTFDDVAVWTTP